MIGKVPDRIEVNNSSPAYWIIEESYSHYWFINQGFRFIGTGYPASHGTGTWWSVGTVMGRELFYWPRLWPSDRKVIFPTISMKVACYLSCPDYLLWLYFKRWMTRTYWSSAWLSLPDPPDASVSFLHRVKKMTETAFRSLNDVEYGQWLKSSARLFCENALLVVCLETCSPQMENCLDWKLKTQYFRSHAIVINFQLSINEESPDGRGLQQNGRCGYKLYVVKIVSNVWLRPESTSPKLWPLPYGVSYNKEHLIGYGGPENRIDDRYLFSLTYFSWKSSGYKPLLNGRSLDYPVLGLKSYGAES